MRTHVHLDVGFLRVHVTVVVRVVGLHVANVVRLRHAVHQVTIQLVGVTQNLRGYDRSVAAECLKRAVRLEFLGRISNPRTRIPSFYFMPRQKYPRQSTKMYRMAVSSSSFSNNLVRK